MHKNTIMTLSAPSKDVAVADFVSFSTCKELRTGKIEREVLIQNIQHKLEENITENLSVNELAGVMYLSQRTLSRRLKNAGVNYRKLLSSVKSKAAKELLFNSALSISDVAQLLGYSDSSNFTKAFKGWNGLTPREYRKSCETRACAEMRATGS